MKTFRTILKAACLALIAASCNNEFDNKATVGSGQLFEASFAENEPQTRVVIDSDLKKVTWEFTDEIGIFDAGYITAVKSTVASIADGGSKAVFSPVTAVANPSYAIHPYMTSSTVDGDAVITTVPATSTGAFGDACIAVSKADDGKFAFKSATAIFQFTVSDPAVKSVTINGTGIAGDIKATFNGSGSVTVAPEGTPSDDITVAAEPNQVCYIAVVPQEYNGLTFTYKDKNGVELGSVKCSDMMTAAPGDLLVWGDFAQLQKAYLPAGPAFNEALKTAAGGNLANIKTLAFMTGYKPSGTVINEGTEGAPIGVEYSGGNVFICTPANEFIANASMSNMFNDLNNVGIISGFEKIDTRETTDMQCVFRYCHKLTSVDLSNLNTSKVTNMLGMFYRCESLASLDVSKFDTSNVTVMQAMFGEMKSLTSLDVSNFNTQKCTNMAHMFSTLSKLEKLTLGSDFKFAANNTNMLYSLGKTNSKPFTTFYCDVDQWNTVTSLIGSTDIVNYRWGNAPAAANLPSGLNFNMALRSAAGGTSNNIKTITFETLSSRTGTVINNGHGDTPVYVSYSSGAITVSTPAAGFNANANSSGMFENMTNLTAINNLASVNTSNVTDMDAVFGYCESLASIDLSNFNTAKVVNMFGMFYENNALTSLDLSEFDTSKVEEMSSMFYGCKKLTSLDLSGFNTAKALRMCYMFRWCESLKSLNLSSFNTAKVLDMKYMFDGCKKLTSITFGSGFTTAKVPNMNSMFRDCLALKSLDLSKFDTSNVTDMHAMFKNCTELTSLDLSSFNTAKVTDMDSLLFQSTHIATLKLGSYFKIPDTAPIRALFNTGLSSGNNDGLSYRVSVECPYDQWMSVVALRKADGYSDAYLVFRWKNAPSYAPLPVGQEFNTALKTAAGDLSNIKTITFETQTRTNSYGTLVNASLGTSPVYIKYDGGAVTIQTPSAGFSTTSCNSYFDGCSALTTINGFEKVNTDNCLSMTRVFFGCTNLTSVNLSKANTANVTNMFALFYNCNSLSSINLSNFNTSKVTSMKSMFYGCSSLTSLDLSHFISTNVTDMSHMFNGCSKLASIKFGTDFNFAPQTSHIFDNLGSDNSSPKTSFTCTPAQWVKTAELLPADNSYKWGNAPATASLPSGNEFNAALKTLAGGNLSNIKNLNFIYQSSSSHYKGLLLNEGMDDAPIYAYFDSATGAASICTAARVKFLANKDCSNMFKGMTDVTFIYNIAYWVSTENTTNMKNMFYDCRKLTSLNLVASSGNTTFVTDKVTDMSYMFHNCYALPALNVTKFNTSNVTTMRAMFDECHALASLNLSSFRTDKVRDFAYMFYANRAMTSLTAKFQTAAATNMQSMFAGMTNVKSIDLGTMEAASVTCMAYMFSGCSSLTSLDISHFRTSQVNTFQSMFSNTDALKTLKLGTNFTISSSANTTDMCKNLGGTSTSGYRTDIYAPQATVTALKSIVDNASYYRWYY